MPMSVLDHLDELRSRLLKVVIVVGLTTSISFWLSDWMLAWLLKPYPNIAQVLTSLTPAGVFVQSMRLALISGLVIAFPIVAYQFWAFISPGLSPKERKVFVVSLYAGTFLFVLGLLFAYIFVIPKALDFFWGYSESFGVHLAWTIESYLNLVLMFLLSFGLAFELPLVLILLVKGEIVSIETITQKRPYIIVALSIIAAILTPPDVMSLIMLLVPLWVLFELSVQIAKWIG